MPDLWSWPPPAGFWVLVGFHLFIVAVLALDLGIFQRKAHSVSSKEAAAWSAVWVSLALLFALGIWRFAGLWYPGHPEVGPEKALEFLTGYLVEQSLSVDNLFVFLVIFRYFGVPDHLRHRVLTWGILGAVVMRATFILAGAALLHFFSWMLYFFGLLLIYTGYKLTRSAGEEIDPGRNPFLRLARRFLPVVDDYASPRFWVRRGGRRYATPLLLVLLVVETTDVVFAIDSIPAIFGITRDPFIVYTSNIFAVIGLRSLYFLLANFLGMFRYLNLGLAGVLMFVGVKMLLEEPCPPLGWPGLPAYLGIEGGDMILLSLGVIALILAVAVAASVVKGPKAPPEPPPEEVAFNGNQEPPEENRPRQEGPPSPTLHR